MSEKHLPPCPTTPGNWKVWTPTWDGEGWRVIGPDGNERGRYLDANVMAEHLAMQTEYADRLAKEIERLRVGLGMIGQIIHGSTRVTRMIAEATLGGANLLDDDVAMSVCEGHWKSAPEGGR
jgi:hypothetical protein